MATYIQGVTDYIPQIQPFKPDFQFYATALQTLQSKYDTNYKQLSDYYGTLLKSPMLRDSNIKRRDEFMNAVQGQIQKISGMDLSLKQNVDQAVRVLEPLVNDKYIINDIVKTRNWNSQRQYSQNIKDTEAWWAGGDAALQYWAEDFKKVNDEDSLSFSNPEYVENVNIMKIALDDMTKNKFVVKSDNFSPDGRWIVTTQNGDLIAPTLRDYLVGRFGSDPKMMKFLNTEAYVNRKNYITSNIDKYEGNEAKAQMAYAQERLDKAITSIKSSKLKADDQKKMIDGYMDAYEDYVSRNGVLPSDKSIINQGQSLSQAQQNATSAKNVADGFATTLDLYNRDYMDFLNNGSKLDQIMAMSNMYERFDAAATQYARLTESKELKTHNPFKLEEMKHANDVALEDMRLKNDLIKIEFKENLKDKKEREKLGIDANTDLQAIPDFAGASTGMNTSGLGINMEKNRQMYGEGSKLKAGFLADVGRSLFTNYDEALSTGDVKAQNVIRNAIKTIYGPLGINEKDMLDPTNRMKTIEKITRLDQHSSPNLFSSYSVAIDQIDPNKNVANDMWAKDVRSNASYYGTLNAIKVSDNAINTFNSMRMEQLRNILIPYFTQDPNNDPTKIVGSILSQSYNGFFPSDNRKDQVINKLVALQEANAKKNGTLNIYTRDYYEKNWDNAKKVWAESMNNIPKYQGWNHIEGLGSSSNATAGMGTMGSFNYGNRSKGSTTNIFHSILKDVQLGRNSLPIIPDNPGGMLLVGYGDNGTILKNSNPEALAQLDAMLGSTTSFYKKDGEKNFSGKFAYANISQNDPNYIGLTIYPSQEYKSSFKETKDVKNPITGEPITVRIPRSIASNVLFQQANTDIYQYSYENNGKVSIDYPSGKATIRESGQGPVVEYSLNIYNAQRKDYDRQTFQSDPYLPDTRINSIVDTYQAVLQKLHAINSVNIENDRMVYGMKDIREIIRQTAEGQQ